MRTGILRILEKFFPVQRQEWPKALMLLSVAILLGMGTSISRATSEALFLTRFGVEALPYLQLVNPFLVMFATTIYGGYASRISNDRLMMYTALVPIPIILLMRFLMIVDMNWVYFALFAFVLAYASLLSTSWAVYLPGHYDVQQAKRLIPFISSGLLIGAVVGGLGVAFCVPVLGAANVLLLWLGVLLGVVVVIQSITRLFTAMGAEARKVKRSAAKTGILSNIKDGVAYSRASALFMTTGLASIVTMMAIQLIDFESSKIFTRHFSDTASLTAFLGVVDGLTTILALMIQWFVVPRCIRRFGVQGTNFLFPASLTLAFGGLLVAPILIPGVFARFTRSSLMPSLRGTTRTLMLNAVPRKAAALVRSFNTGVVMPLGQTAGALLLVLMKGLAISLLFPVVGLLISVLYIYYSYKQNAAYGEALLDLLKEDKIHLLDLEDEEIQQLDAAAVTAISSRLNSAEDDVGLAAVELLRSIGSEPAYAALRQHLPYPAPIVTAAALRALAAMSRNATAILQPYIDDAHPVVRMAALEGLRQLGDTTLPQRAVTLLDDADVEVRAMALSVVLGDSNNPEYARAYRLWEEMLDSTETATLVAALGIIADVPHAAMQGRLYRSLDHVDERVQYVALAVLRQLASAGRITAVDAALLQTLEAEAVELRSLALQVLSEIATDEALGHMLVLLDDEQPRVREALLQTLKRFGRLAREPLFSHLRSPRTSLLAKETALLALASIDGVRAEQFLAFWEAELHDVYRYKLMLACLEESAPLPETAFLQAALQNAHDEILSLLVQLLAVWTSPEVARLVESGLYDTDQSRRASALEALESLSDRRFTRLFLPILQAAGDQSQTWREVAQRYWHLSMTEISEVIRTCLESANKWIVIGALFAGQARADSLGDSWSTTLTHLATEASDLDIRKMAQRLAGPSDEPEQALSLTDIMLFLKRIPLYSSMTLEQLHTIALHMTEREVQAGEVIFQAGDLSYDLYLIVSGKVDIVLRHEDRKHVLATLPEGEFFGDMAIFEDRPRSADAVAAEHSLLLMLSPERFRQIIMQEPAISFEIFRELCARLRRFDEQSVVAQ